MTHDLRHIDYDPDMDNLNVVSIKTDYTMPGFCFFLSGALMIVSVIFWIKG